MRNRFLSLLLSFIFSSTLSAVEKEHEYTSISSVINFKHLAKNALLLEDSEYKYSLKEILSDKQLKGQFTTPSVNIPYLDFTNSTYWMKVKVHNDTSIKKSYYLELARPLTNLINLYVIDENGDIQKHYQAGDDLPFQDRPYMHRKFIFPIHFEANSKHTLVIETKSDGEILKLPVKLWNIDAFTQFVSMENFFLGLFYGFLVLVFVLFSFFAIALRKSVYVVFIGYVLFLGLFQFALDGFAFQFFWPNSPWMGNHSILIFAAISMLFILGYAHSILEFQTLNKTYFNIYKAFYVLVSIGLLTSFTSGVVYELTFPILNGLQVIMSFYFFLGIYLKFKQGKTPTWPLTMGFVFLWLGAMVFVLANVNIIENEFLAANTLKLGSAIEVTFLSIAMAGQYRETQRDKLEAQDEAYKRLEEINDLKNLQTEKLEQQVKERTFEISEKNDILTSQNKEIINSINYAKRLQDAILPSKKLMEACFKASGILFLPKDIVSGDFYWMEATQDKVYFAVADCTGHGVPGALVSVVGHNALNRCVNEMKLKDPGEILDRLTDLVEHTFTKDKSEESSMNDGMDICLCVWDYKQSLKYAGAFNPLYLIRDGELMEFKGDKQPIGKFIKRDPFTTYKINLQKDDSIYLFSDGYADQFGGERGKKLKYSVFKEYLLAVNQAPASELSETLNQRFIEWKGDEDQIDDVCIMNVRF